ncbi:MAG: C40 family peptidase, partial [Cytophagales bacterium]|nr:C40 family peptidase [Cytophagales bacterium]
DCSGFCLFVFKEFGIELPRKSDEQAKMGKQIPVSQAQKGDLIFFKGSDKNKPVVGHVGIIVSYPGERLKFIHSSTSKGIIYDYLDVKYFSERLVSVKRLF